MTKMIDGIGRPVRKGDIVFTTSGSMQSISTGIAIVVSDDKPSIKRREVTRDRVWDEPGFNYRGEPDDAYGSYGDKERTRQRKYHFENERQQLTGTSHLNLGFRRSVIVNVDDISDTATREFFRTQQEKLRSES